MIAVNEEGIPPIAVVVPTAAMPRYMHFEMALEALWVPNKSSLSRVQGPALAKNLNDGIRNAAPEAEFFWFEDDDHKFPPQIAVRLARHRVPIVVALTCVSRPPFSPTIYKSATREGDGKTYHHPYAWSELDGKSGLMPVFACGRAGMLVRRDVLDLIGDPWFRLGQVPGNPEEANEDMDFCARVREKNIEILADLDTVQGHMSPCTAWPTMDAKGRWVVRFEWENNRGFTLNRAEP